MVGVESEISATSDSNQDSLWGACHNHHTRLRKLCQELERETAQTLSRIFGAMPSISLFLFGTLFFFFLFEPIFAGCPHCSGNLASCTFDTNQKCPLLGAVTHNMTVVAAGVGVLSLANVIKPRFLRLFSRVSFETILALVARSAPGTPFEVTVDTKVPEIMQAIANSRVTMETVVLKLCNLVEEAADDGVRATVTRRLECIKTACDIQHKVGVELSSNLFDTGILTFMWAKVSEFVMAKDMQVKLTGDLTKSESSSANKSAKVVRPQDSMEFSEMLNLFILYTHALGICSCMMVTDFLEHIVYDTIRQRKETWQFAHELMLVTFRRIEDSAGRLNLGNSYNEVYLNDLMSEARANTSVFFRSPGGNPGTVNDKKPDGEVKIKKWNGKFSPSSKFACKFFNTGTEHPTSGSHLLADGTCKYNHACDQWVSNKGPKGRCMATGHIRGDCDNPHKCVACVN